MCMLYGAARRGASGGLEGDGGEAKKSPRLHLLEALVRLLWKRDHIKRKSILIILIPEM